MATPTSILIIGLDFQWTAVHRADLINPAVLRGNVQRRIEDLAKVTGLETETLLVNPDKDDALDEIGNKLREGKAGKKWDGVIFGWGMRGIPDTSALFEAMVNRVKDEAPKARFMFTLAQPNHWEAIQRNFPHLKKDE
ncbi:hypothetical protein GTA08_BOTSDO03163 [Botryosphaeria dothidea]|uniref:Uncharacterized protein n=1 Tax=Botryosphaeria dothidea TaxID=55169 RepID=A0A8H4IXF3_9PEZI|nr:hypothetical protein GTA08_BOTSDO03163 [Botryosphaeria dothidea]